MTDATKFVKIFCATCGDVGTLGQLQNVDEIPLQELKGQEQRHRAASGCKFPRVEVSFITEAEAGLLAKELMSRPGFTLHGYEVKGGN